MLSRNNRLTDRERIVWILRKGRSVRGVSVNICFTPNSTTRFAVVVSSKVSAKAVVRNRVRRKIREAVRGAISKLHSPCDAVVIARKNSVDATVSVFTEEFGGMFKRM